MSNYITDLSFGWQPQGPLLSGYDYKFSREAGLIQPGEKKVAQYQSRNAQHRHRPSLLATSVKGVFHSAAAWLVEREGQLQQRPSAQPRRYITCDYGNAVPERGGWDEAVEVIKRRDGLCPVCRVFGGTGCVSGRESSNALRRQGIVRFQFEGNNDAIYGTLAETRNQLFAWEVASDRPPKPVIAEQWVAPKQMAHLLIHVQADDQSDHHLALALLGLSADLISSGFFRFGRFTSRGYGWVRLTEPAATSVSLVDLLATEDDLRQRTAPQRAQDGAALAARLLQPATPEAVLRDAVAAWSDD